MTTLPGDPTLPPGVTMNDIDPPHEPEEMSDLEAADRLWSALHRLARFSDEISRDVKDYCNDQCPNMYQGFRSAINNAKIVLQETER